ncbi:hypothetical protein Pmani_015917 [Petrolisthes manimaculis]|uniref:Uncharacterized protein n=1 Tax=Petrolisthes manimaculis TaxID=1843537 RepID=A0AAE1PR92_9EUCA|nr:hypothetical protein Pmani_015917 [Petrolisthes manimaculis]
MPNGVLPNSQIPKTISLSLISLNLSLPFIINNSRFNLRSLGLQYSSVSLLKLLLLPWLLKGLWAPVVEVGGGRKRWLVASLLALALAALTGSLIWPEDLTGVGMLLLGLNVFSAVQDVAVDGFALLVMPDHLLGVANTIQVVLYKVGCLIGGAGLTYLLAFTSWPTTFSLLALLYAITAIWATCINTDTRLSGATIKREEERINTRQDAVECEEDSVDKCPIGFSGIKGES